MMSFRSFAKQLESNPSHELIQELCGEHPKLCALIGRQAASCVLTW